MENDEKDQLPKGLKLMVISDGTGETASRMARAAMAQFPEHDVYFTRFKNIRTTAQIDSIFTQASIHHDMVIYTIVNVQLREYIKEQSAKMHVRSVDLMGDLLTSFTNFFQTGPLSTPGLLHQVNDQYFARVAAMEFTLNHDDGQNPDTLEMADCILVGISRTSKTPLSIYLSLHGLKVVNVPLVLGTAVNEQLFKIDQSKIYALTIDAGALYEIRKNRLHILGATKANGDYADMKKIYEEVEWANSIFKENKRWPVLDVTGKAIEETASEILKIMAMKQNNLFKHKKRFAK